MILSNAEELVLEQASPQGTRRGRRLLVIVLGTILAVVACGTVGLGAMEGSWWHSEGMDRALSHESRARVGAIRDELDASGAAPEAVVWLDAVLDPNADPTTVRFYLLAAQELLEEANDPDLTETVREIRTILQMIRPASFEGTTIPRVPTVEWP